MKIRSGFVSNSSSSSFVAVLSKESFNRLREEINPISRIILDSMRSKEKKFGGTIYMLLYRYTSTEDCDLSPLIQMLGDTKNRKEIDLPSTLWELEDIDHCNVYDALYDSDIDPHEFMEKFEIEVRKKLRELEDKSMAITWEEGR